MTTIRPVSEAVGLVDPGDTLVFSFAHAQPPVLIAELAAQAPRFIPPVTIYTTAAAFGSFEHASPAAAPYFQTKLIHPGSLGAAVSDGRAVYVPIDPLETSRLLDDRVIRSRVAFVHATPPDERGYCSLGLSIGSTLAAMRSADIVIAQYNPNLPWTHGESEVAAADFDVVVPAASDLVEVPRSPSQDRQRLQAIAANVRALVRDGASVQIGVGSLADEIVFAMTGKRKLTFHSGMVTDSVQALVTEGVLDTHGDVPPVRTGGVIGSRVLYGWCERNPLVWLESSETLHRAVAKDLNFTAINSALEVDITGQVNVETAGGRLRGGVGGHLRYMMSAGESHGGRAILALPSTSSGGHSRIRASLAADTVGTPRSAVHFVVTEYGVADLQGKSLPERIEAMIAVAHPDVRASLRHEAPW